MARSTHAVVVTPSASATSSTRTSRLTGSRHVTATRGAVRTGRPRFRLISVTSNESLVDTELQPHVFEGEEEWFFDYVGSILCAAEKGRSVGEDELLELEPVRVFAELVVGGLEQTTLIGVEMAEVDVET
jgi:hypothetical protein